MFKKILILNLLLFAFVGFNCNPTEPPVNIPLKLTIDDVSCTEAWLKLRADNASGELIVTRDQSKTIAKFTNPGTIDTVIYIDSLLPNKTYNFQAVLTENGKLIGTSEKITGITLYTTTHNFSWETFSFGGDAGSCLLNDVAIINENNIWAVGEINIADTSINGYTTYNAVHWDGNEWELKRILYNGNIWAIKTIFAFNENDIWFSAFVRFDGKNFIELPIPEILMGWNINKIWGSSSNDLYVIGNNGNIALHQNENWAKIESKTELTLTDIFGKNNEVYISGSNINFGKGIVLKRNNLGFESLIESDIVSEIQLFNPKLYGSFAAVWVDEKGALYTGGNLFFRYKFGKWELVKSLPENFIGGNPGVYYRGYISSIRGEASNDMWIAGDRNTLRHFNGVTWQQIGLPYSPNSDVIWAEIKTNGNIAVAVGSDGNQAIIIVMKRG